jgi:hypothetical protein
MSQANQWDSLPCVYKIKTDDGITVTQFLPAGWVSEAGKKFRDERRKEFKDLNNQAKEIAVSNLEAEIKSLNLVKDEAENHRQRYPVWEIPEPEPMGVIFDSRTSKKTGTVNTQPLPAGLKKT